MDQIQHKFIDCRGVKLHIAEIGTGSPSAGSTAVVFIHGFPEIWYSWRHQMIVAAVAGYRAIALDLRGYGLSDPHPQPQNASFDDFVEDTLGILDSLHIHEAFLVGKDFGSWVVYLFSLIHPTRVAGIVSLGVPFLPPNPNRYRDLPEGFYIFRWKENGRAEADFGRFDVKTVLHKIYILFSKSEIPIAEKDEEIMDMVDESTPPPPWLTDEDLAAYATAYQNSGFESALQVPYRSRHKELSISNPTVEVPVLLIIGGKDYFLKFPGVEEYIKSEKMREFVAELEVAELADGTHFMQEQFPAQLNQLLISFLSKHNLCLTDNNHHQASIHFKPFFTQIIYKFSCSLFQSIVKRLLYTKVIYESFFFHYKFLYFRHKEKDIAFMWRIKNGIKF